LGTKRALSLLYLSNLEKARTSSVAKKANLQGKRHLRYLSLECTTRIGSGSQIKDNIQQDKHQIEDVFEELCPPACLKNLSLLGFFGHQLPKWMSSGKMALKYLRSIKLEDCTNCEQLPALGHLLSLDFLLIKHEPSITRIGHEFFCSSNVTQMNQQMLFPRLEKLGFDRLDGWEEWIWDKELEQAMPNIFSLKIKKCKLKYFPPGLVHQTRALKELIISEACNLTSVANFILLSDLHLYANPKLEMLANLPKLRRLSVIQCPKLNVLMGLTELQSITLQDYGAELFPQYLEETSAAKLEVFCNEELFKLIIL